MLKVGILAQIFTETQLSGTTVDVAIDGEQEKRTIAIDSIVGVEFVNEETGESV